MNQPLFNRAGQAHEANTTTGRNNDLPARRFRTPCGKCRGTGNIPQFGYYAEGVCFDCAGKGSHQYTERLFTADQLDKLQAAEQRRNAKRNAEREAELAKIERERIAAREAFTAAQPELVAFLSTIEPDQYGSFLAQMSYAIKVGRGSLTDGQVAAVQKTIDQRRAEEAAKANSKPFGEVGKRYKKVRATVTFSKSLGFNYDFYPPRERCLSKLITDTGEILVWFGGYTLAKGGHGLLSFTVKEHGAYQDAVQTTIQRPVFDADWHNPEISTIEAKAPAPAAVDSEDERTRRIDELEAVAFEDAAYGPRD